LLKGEDIKLGNTKYVVITSFKDDEDKNHVVLKPAICFYCGEPITAKKGESVAKKGDLRGKKSLLIHSLDGNHDNMISENKVSSHKGCHTRFHKSGERNYWFGAKGEEASFFGKKFSPEAIEKMRLAKLGNKKVWETRRERYGPTGTKKV